MTQAHSGAWGSVGKRLIRAAAATVAISVFAPDLMGQSALPAFSGAEGAGMYASGGRGQQIYHVTNLNLSGPGSFADAVSKSNRYVVFDVGGTAVYNGGGPQNYIRVGASNITIAGETAPGQGFTISGITIKFTGDNVVVRNIRSRPGFDPDPNKQSSYTYDSFGIQTTNSIFDHVSAQFATDEGISPTDRVHATTIQYASISNSLNGLNHSFGSLVNTEKDGAPITIAHTLYANVRSRLPRVGSPGMTNGATLDFVNNTIYNWNGNAGYSGSDGQPSKNNFIGNYYLYGASSVNSLHMFGNYDPGTHLFISGNAQDTNKNGKIDGSVVSSSAFYAGSNTQPVVSSSAYAIQGTYVQSAAAGLEQTLNYAGAFWWNRDQVDADSANDVRHGTGTIINNISDRYSGTTWQTPASAHPAGYDTDGDGMPNVWEAAMGLNPSVADHNGDVNSNGYTNIEKFAQERGAFPAPAPIVFNPAGGRVALITNWTISQTSPRVVSTPWSPSRFDEAQINAGTAVVDAAGQHARLLKIASSAGNTAAMSVTGGWLNVSDRLLVGPGGSGSVTQTGGIVHVRNGVVLGSTGGTGTYTLAGGTLSADTLSKTGSGSALVITGGTLHANTVGFSLTNQGGTIAPGSDASIQRLAAASMPDINGMVDAPRSLIATMRVQGDLTLASGWLEIDLASATVFDRLTIDNALSLGGGLNVLLRDGYSPIPGDRWLIGTAGTITGGFSSITSGFGTETSGGNLYLVAVPEPGSLSLLGLGGLALLRRRRS